MIYQPNFFPTRENIDPEIMYVGLPIHGWVPLKEAVSHPKYFYHFNNTIECVTGYDLIERIDVNKSAVKLALDAIEHDFRDADIVGLLVNTVCVPRRVEVTVRYEDGTKTTYRQNQDDEAAEAWEKVCSYSVDGSRH